MGHSAPGMFIALGCGGIGQGRQEHGRAEIVFPLPCLIDVVVGNAGMIQQNIKQNHAMRRLVQSVDARDPDATDRTDHGR
jgi:hypothetical protein